MQMPSAADLSLLLSLGMGGLDASQLANLDLQKLAMYLVSIENPQKKSSNSFLYQAQAFFQNSPQNFNSHEENWHKRNFYLNYIVMLE